MLYREAHMKAKINKDQVKTLLEVLAAKLNAPKNSEIRASLRSMLDNADLRELRDVMHLSGFKSVDYSFIKEDILRTQLEVDNLRMEDAACSSQIKNEEERFFIFCINAFYQIENITNYYFVKKFPNFPDLMKYMEEHSNFKHKENQKTQEIVEKSVGDIDIACKIFALCGELFPSTEEQPDFTYKTINHLRLVRNEGFHRCQVEGKASNERLEKFYKYNDFITIRETLRKYVAAIQYEIELPERIQKEIDEYIEIPDTREGILESVLKTVKTAFLLHVPANDKHDDFWKISISDGTNKAALNVHEKYFVKRYDLPENKDMLSLLPFIRVYLAVHKDYKAAWEADSKVNFIAPSEPDVMKKYHIVRITEIIEH